jgi:hypothetical protein
MTFRDHIARADAWKRYALRLRDLRFDAEVLADDARSEAVAIEIGGCSRCAALREEIQDLERDAREEARGAYGEGYQRGREDSGDGY